MRQKWVDIAKGLGIIAVVIGHSGVEFTKFIFWFHMPLFFILGGYVHKQSATFADFRRNSVKLAYRLLVPYASFLIIVSLMMVSAKGFNSIEGARFLLSLLAGGRLLSGFYGVFWFITCLFITKVLFDYLALKCSAKVTLLIAAAAFLLAHAEAFFISSTGKTPFIPWNADVTLLAISYYAIGSYAKKHPVLIKQRLLFPLIGATIIAGYYFGMFDYSLDMKNAKYNSLVLDLIIPLTFSGITCISAQLIEKLKASSAFEHLGQNTLVIMYLHVPVNMLLRAWEFSYGAMWFTILGIFLPIIFMQIVRLRPGLRTLFLGSPTKEDRLS